MGLGAIFFAVSNVTFMTKGLLEYEALFMVPVYEGSMVISNVLSAIGVLGEMDDAPAWRLCVYFVCIGLIISGLWILVTAEGKYGIVNADENQQMESAADVVP